MKTSKRKYLVPLSLVALAHLSIADMAYADTAEAVIDYLPPKNVYVKSDGYIYDQNASDMTITAGHHVDIDAEISGKIKNWQVWMVTTPEGGVGQHHNSGGDSESYSFGNRPKEVHQNGSISADMSTSGKLLCNQLAETLRNNGMGNEDIFAQDRIITIGVQAVVDFEATGTGADPEQEVQDWNGLKKFDLVCKAFKAAKNPAIGPAAGHFGVQQSAHLTSVTLDMFYEKTPTTCPTEVTAYATYVSQTQGSFTTRFKSAFNQISQPIKLTMSAADKQGDLYIKTYQKKFMVGEPAQSDPTRTKPVKPGVTLDRPGGFAPAPGNPADDIPSGPTGPQAAGGGKVAAPSLPNIYQDSLMIEVVSAGSGSVQKSDYAGYKVTCKFSINPAINPVGGISVGKQPEYNKPIPASLIKKLPTKKTAPTKPVVVPGAIIVLPVAPEPAPALKKTN